MKKILTSIVSLVVVALIFGAVYIVAFDKKIPTNWVSAQIEAVKTSKLENEVEVYKTPLSMIDTEITYTKDGDKTITTYDLKASREVKDTSSGDNESYEVKCVDYDTKGDVKEIYYIKYYMEGEQHIKEESILKLK